LVHEVLHGLRHVFDHEVCRQYHAPGHRTDRLAFAGREQQPLQVNRGPACLIAATEILAELVGKIVQPL
jgi:hypothetical protein